MSLDVFSKSEIILENPKAMAVVASSAIVPGSVLVAPKKRSPILELVDHGVLSDVVSLSLKTASKMFESYPCQGTYLVINSGLGAGQTIAHGHIEVVPVTNDVLTWEPLAVSNDQLEDLMITLKGYMERSEKPEVKASGDTEVELEKQGDNYLVKSLRRRP